MKGSRYSPIPIDTRMSQYGYWIVTISTGPSERLSVMVATIGIDPDKAISDALATIDHLA